MIKYILDSNKKPPDTSSGGFVWNEYVTIRSFFNYKLRSLFFQDASGDNDFLNF